MPQPRLTPHRIGMRIEEALLRFVETRNAGSRPFSGGERRAFLVRKDGNAATRKRMQKRLESVPREFFLTKDVRRIDDRAFPIHRFIHVKDHIARDAAVRERIATHVVSLEDCSDTFNLLDHALQPATRVAESL